MTFRKRAARRLEQLGTSTVRRVRSVPAAEAAAVRVVTRVRDSGLARKAVSRAFDIDVTGVGGTVFLGSGHLLAGAGLENLPVVVLSLVGTPAEEVAPQLDAVAREQVLTAGFRPVVVLDSDHLALVRGYGWPVELVITEADWLAADGAWGDYLEHRLQQIRRDYQASALLPLGAGHALTHTYLRSLGPATPCRTTPDTGR